MDNTRIITRIIIEIMIPPNLFGIDRKIAYTYIKYHSGLIWIGVTIGLAGEKFSFDRRKCWFSIIHINIIMRFIVKIVLIISLIEKFILKFILSMFGFS